MTHTASGDLAKYFVLGLLSTRALSGCSIVSILPIASLTRPVSHSTDMADRLDPDCSSIKLLPTRREINKTNYDVSDRDDDELDDEDDYDSKQTTGFTYYLNSPFLYSPSRAIFQQFGSPGNQPGRFRSRARKRRYVVIQRLRMPALIILSVAVIVFFYLFPWNTSRSTLSLSRSRPPGESSDMFAVHNLSAPDGSIHGSFIGIGASVQSLFVKDRYGAFRDVVLGYDDTSEYMNSKTNPRFGAVVGRYANRIKNSSFAVPRHPDKIYHTTPNEHGGLNTLHGGVPGWDRRPFKVETKNLSYISFSLIDRDGEQGFPSTVSSHIEYELQTEGRWSIRMSAKVDGPTPVMLSSHVYWNLDAYSSNQSALDHYLQLDAHRYLVVDGILIPTGQITNVRHTPLDFTQPVKIGSRFNQTEGLCGTDCNGYDNAWVYSSHRNITKPVMHMWSSTSGIKMSVTTNQPCAQVYTCNNIAPTDALIKPIERKVSQSGPDSFYENHSCVVIEQQGWIDAINNPHWRIDDIYDRHRPYEWNAVYQFSTV